MCRRWPAGLRKERVAMVRAMVLVSVLCGWPTMIGCGNDPDRPMGASAAETTPDDDAGRESLLGPTPTADAEASDGGAP